MNANRSCLDPVQFRSIQWARAVLVLVVAMVIVAANTRAVMVDMNANGMSDIWEDIYGASALAPNADADGDGVANILESIAGTNPFDSNSAPRISFGAVSGTNFAVAIQSVLGKQYSLQSVPWLGPGSSTNWLTETSLVARAGTVVNLSARLTNAPRFFRVAIGDVDTDGDGVSDAEEYQLGLDPMRSASNGQLDGNGLAIGDYAYATNRLAFQNVFSIAATDPTANQPDAGQSPLNLGMLTVSRGGFPLNAVSVNVAPAAPAPGMAVENLDYTTLPRVLSFPAGVVSQTVTVSPMANTNLAAPAWTTLNLYPGTGYSLGSPTNSTVLIYPSSTARGIGLTGQYYTNASATYSSVTNFNPTNLVMTVIDTNINFTWGNTTNPIPNSGYYCVRWTGQVQPQYSETYYFVANTDDGVKLWVNDQLIIDKWVVRTAADSIGAIDLQADARYNVKMEYFQSTGSASAKLYWYSASQSKQIIPANRLYPTSTPAGPCAVTSPLYAPGFLGQPFSYTITGANSPARFWASPLPPGLGLNATNGLLSGTPSIAGIYQVQLTASNSVGAGSSILSVQIFDTGSAVTREVWTGVPGVTVGDIPVGTTAAATSALGALEGITDYGDNYGERIRGYLTAPATGNYYFWIAGSDSAELWISNDSEPCNKVRRAYVSTNASTTPRQWTLRTNQCSPWLALVAGQRYYLEVLHKAGSGSNDNWSVGWRPDSTGTNLVPSGVVPSYVLSRYFPLPATYQPGSLYTATMLAQAGVASSGVGSATLRVNADGSQAALKFSYANLNSPVTGMHIHSDPYLGKGGQIVFDIDAATPQPDGSYLWNIADIGALTKVEILEIIREGKAFINIHTATSPGGEINGHFTLANGTQTFSPPLAPPPWTDDHASSNAAARFLIQATFGPSPAEIANVMSLGYSNWIQNQFSLPPTYHLPYVLANVSADPTTPYPGSLTFNAWWKQSVTAPDQLRQRVALALSEIMVVSENGILQNNARVLSDYYDMLLDNAFGNVRELIEAVTLSPAMGLYLDMRANDKGDITTGRHPNENYAREILQLFSVGLNRMWPDGTLVLNSQDVLVPTYDQNVIMGYAAVFTGWNYYQTNQANGRLPTGFSPSANYTNAMVLVPTHHELGTKRLLDNIFLPPAWGAQTNSANVEFDTYCSQDLERALDVIFYNENAGPFLCRQLIQRLVTSNPSREYLYRVVNAFKDNGAGVRGDLRSVIQAILLDYEARSTNLLSQSTYGKQREPLLRVTAPARAFPSPPDNGGSYSQSGTQLITVTTSNAHRLNNSDMMLLSFTDSSGQPTPPAQGYSVTVTGPSSFTVNAPNLTSGTYTQATNTVILTLSSHGLAAGKPVYLTFTTGGASSGLYQVLSVLSTSSFTVSTPDSATRSGNCLMHKIAAAGYSQATTNITVSCTGAHGLTTNETLYLNFASGTAVPGQYQVVTIPDATRFTVTTTNSATQTQSGFNVYPLGPPPLSRSGTVAVQANTWNVGSTDSSLTQTALRSPTVFNFFFPDYKFPGALSSAGMTTPEFQLTSDTEVAVQMNFLANGLLNNGNNTNGLSSFTSGDGDIVLDVGPYMTTNYTATPTGVGTLVDALSSLLTAGQLSASARAQITNYVASTNLAYGTPPTQGQIRDRVRAAVHLLLTSPDFTIQK